MKRDLYSRLFDNWTFPVLDRANRTQVSSKLKHLLSAERASPEDIRREQHSKLRHILKWTRDHSEFYQQLWKNHRGRDAPASEYPELDRLPIVTKQDLRAAEKHFPLPAYRGRTIACRTSGSTGSPMTFYRSLEQESWFWALRFRIWRWSGYRPGDPYLEINLNPRIHWKKLLQDRLFRCTYLTYNMENLDSRHIADAIITKRIPHLNGFASSLYVLARYISEVGVECPSVVGITSTGDALFPAYRDTIESAFGRPVFDYYGAGGEGLHLASQCEEMRYHLHPENAIVEILGREGPVPIGQHGRIVVTQLDNLAMPLIRYDLEDLAVPASTDETCRCNRTLPLLDRIEGRVPDLISTPREGFLASHFFVVLFKNIQSVHRYQVIQDQIDRLRVRLVARTSCDRSHVEALVSKAISDATGGSLGTDFEWLSEIPLSGAGKRRLVVSHVSRDIFQGKSSQPPESSSESSDDL